jgi:hypothetical protein
LKNQFLILVGGPPGGGAPHHLTVNEDLPYR